MKERLTKLIKEAQERYIYAEDMAQYLMDNGVIVPPCKVGDTVYSVMKGGLMKCCVTCVRIDDYSDERRMEILCKEIRSRPSQHVKCFGAADFGKTVFLTREEAERALKGGVQE